jgi:hypothetical protein
MAGPALLAHVLVSKFDDHLPLYRQGEIFARMGADIPRSTLIDWCGQAVATLRPLTDLIRAEVMRSDRLHADDTPIRVLDPGRRAAEGKTRGVKEGRIWVYLRDDRPWGGNDPPAVTYFFSPDRKGEHPQAHLAGFEGVLQADAYGGFRKLYEPGAEGHRRIREAACWAHYPKFGFIRSGPPPAPSWPVTAAPRTPHNFRLRGAMRRCGGDRRCRCRCTPRRAPRPTSGTVHGAPPNWAAVRCIRRAAAPSLATAAIRA